MRFEGELLPATFLSRPNRFLGEVEIDGERAPCFIPNPGRMRELLSPGARVYVIERRSPLRKTGYDMVLVELDGVLVSVDSRVPNAVLGEAIAGGKVPEFRGFRVGRREPTFLDSRLDFELTDGEKMLLEVKSCTLVVGGVGLFPDAPTRRGRRHLEALTEALSLGRAAILFHVQRGDASSLMPNEGADPAFSGALRRAAGEGVEVYAYNSRVTLGEVSLNRRVPVTL